ncbi:MAG: hypothetical protein ACREQ9_03775, partial [Candidatus Binatia bacterium]
LELSLALPENVGVAIAQGGELEIRQVIRNDYWVGPAPYRNVTTAAVYVNVHLASSVEHEAEPFQDDTGTQALLVPPQSYGATGGVWLPADAVQGAMVRIWSDRRAIRAELQGAPAGEGYAETDGGPIAYDCSYANGWLPNRVASIGSNGANATLNLVTGPIDLSAGLKWGCQEAPNVPAGLPGLVGDPAVSCARSSESPYSGNDCGSGGRCTPANLVAGPGVDDGRCSLVGLWW